MLGVGFEHAQLDARLPQKLHRELVGVRILVNDLDYARVDEHLGAHHTGLRGHVNRSALDIDAVLGRLDDGVLLGMQTAANLVALPAGNAELLAQATRLGAMAQPAGNAVVTRCQDAAVLNDHRAHRTAQARGAGFHLLGQIHEVLVPAWAMVLELAGAGLGRVLAFVVSAFDAHNALHSIRAARKWRRSSPAKSLTL